MSTDTTAPVWRKLPRCQHWHHSNTTPDGTDSCGEPATWTVTWPDGIPLFLCDTHAEEIQNEATREPQGGQT